MATKKPEPFNPFLVLFVGMITGIFLPMITVAVINYFADLKGSDPSSSIIPLVIETIPGAVLLGLIVPIYRSYKGLAALVMGYNAMFLGYIFTGSWVHDQYIFLLEFYGIVLIVSLFAWLVGTFLHFGESKPHPGRVNE
jgi:hypothetical protein